MPSHAFFDHFKIHVAAVNQDMPHRSAVTVFSLHDHHDIFAKGFSRQGFFRCLTKRLAEFWGIYRVEPYFELLVIFAKARDRVAVVNVSDAQVELLGFFVGAVGGRSGNGSSKCGGCGPAAAMALSRRAGAWG